MRTDLGVLILAILLAAGAGALLMRGHLAGVHRAEIATADRHRVSAETARARADSLLEVEASQRIDAEARAHVATTAIARADSLQAVLDTGSWTPPAAAELDALQLIDGDEETVLCGVGFVGRCLFVQNHLLPATRSALDSLQVAFAAQADVVATVTQRAELLSIEASERGLEADALRRALDAGPPARRPRWDFGVDVAVGADQLIGSDQLVLVGLVGLEAMLGYRAVRLRPSISLRTDGELAAGLRATYRLLP